MITITFEDQVDGTVKIVCTPPANELFAKFKNGHTLKPEESMAVMGLLRVLAESKKANYNQRKIHLVES